MKFEKVKDCIMCKEGICQPAERPCAAVKHKLCGSLTKACEIGVRAGAKTAIHEFFSDKKEN